MKITQGVPNYAATLNDKEQGMAQMSENSGSWAVRCMSLQMR